MDTSRSIALCACLYCVVCLTAGCDAEQARAPRSAAQTGVAATHAVAASDPLAVDAGAAREPRSPIDVALISKVESALAAEPDLHGSTIAVKASDGVVTLAGTTRDPQLRSMAAQVALSVQGVKLVRNELALDAA